VSAGKQRLRAVTVVWRPAERCAEAAELPAIPSKAGEALTPGEGPLFGKTHGKQTIFVGFSLPPFQLAPAEKGARLPTPR